jgi:hypothetical protein
MHGYRNKNTVRPFLRVLLGVILLFFFYLVVKTLLTAPWIFNEQMVNVFVSSIAMIFVGYLCLFGHVPRFVIKIFIKVNRAERKMWKKLKAGFSR